jgi:hypothetical protein
MLLLVLVYKYLLSSLTGRPLEKGLKPKTTFEAFYTKAALSAVRPISFFTSKLVATYGTIKFFYSKKFLFYAENSLRSLYVTFGAFHGITLGAFFYSIHFSYPCCVGGNVALGWVLGEAMVRPLFRKIRRCPDFPSCFPGPSFFDR